MSCTTNSTCCFPDRKDSSSPTEPCLPGERAAVHGIYIYICGDVCGACVCCVKVVGQLHPSHWGRVKLMSSFTVASLPEWVGRREGGMYQREGACCTTDEERREARGEGKCKKGSGFQEWDMGYVTGQSNLRV